MIQSEKRLRMLFPYIDEDGIERLERLWVKPLEGYYEIDNIPFYVKNYSLGDLVSGCVVQNELTIRELVKASGNSTIQIVFYDKFIIMQTREQLKLLNCASEISNIPSLIGVNIPSEVDYFGLIEPLLQEGFNAELWDFQEACLAHK